MATKPKFVLMGELYMSEGMYMLVVVARGSLKRCERAMSDSYNQLIYRSLYIAYEEEE